MVGLVICIGLNSLEFFAATFAHFIIVKMCIMFHFLSFIVRFVIMKEKKAKPLIIFHIYKIASNILPKIRKQQNIRKKDLTPEYSTKPIVITKTHTPSSSEQQQQQQQQQQMYHHHHRAERETHPTLARAIKHFGRKQLKALCCSSNRAPPRCTRLFVHASRIHIHAVFVEKRRSAKNVRTHVSRAGDIRRVPGARSFAKYRLRGERESLTPEEMSEEGSGVYIYIRRMMQMCGWK